MMTRRRIEWYAGLPPKNYKEKRMELIMPRIGRKEMKWYPGLPGN